MKSIKVKYPTQTQLVKIADKNFVLEVIRSLDEAIDILCAELSEEEQADPFAEDLCPYFGILWPAARALSNYLGEHPEFTKGKTAIELGCGLGLPSLVAAHLGADVLATDFHPDVEEYFMRNTRHSDLSVKYQRLNWREDNALGTYDLVLGSDILYESKHAREVAEGLIKYTRPGSCILLADPGRAYLQKFLDAMNELGFKEEVHFIDIDGKEQFVIKFMV